MADDLDKFVLQYSVDLRDSIEDLKKLHAQMSEVKKGSKESGKELKNFAADATQELEKLVPGLGMVSRAIRGMGAEFAVAAAGIAALAVSIKSVMDLRNQYNLQRQQGMDLGVSGLRVENYQRAFVREGRGYIDREKAMEGLQKFREMTRAAYTDPTRMGKEAMIMRRFFGVDVGRPGAPTSFNDNLAQLATNLQGKSAGEIQGIAKATGYAQDWLLTLQRLGPTVGSMTDLTETEIKARDEAQKSLDSYNKSLADLKESYSELNIQLGQSVIPMITEVTRALSGLVKLGNDFGKNWKEHGSAEYKKTFTDSDAAKVNKGGVGVFDSFWNWITGDNKTPQEKKEADEKQKEAQKKLDDQTKIADKQSEQGQQTADQMTLAINQFSAAVGSFAGAAPSVQEVLAAWAGGAGKAAGIYSGNGAGGAAMAAAALTGGGGSWQQSQYAAQLGAAAKKYGLDPQDLYSVMMIESSGVNGKYSPTGAGGLMQVTRGNWKAYGGGRNVMDTAANIDVGARILKESYAMHPGDKAAGLRQYNGNSDPNYVTKFNQVYGGGSRAEGFTRSTIQAREVASGLANALGVPVEQLVRGDVNSKDVAFALGAARGKLQNEIMSGKSAIDSLSGLTDPTSRMNMSGLQAKLQADQLKLQNLNAYGDRFVGNNSGGFKSPSIESQINNFNITSSDPKAVAAEVEAFLHGQYQDTAANFSTGRKS